MSRPIELMKTTHRLLTGVLVAAACTLTQPIVALAEPASVPATQEGAAPGHAGQWIHVDPQTGKRVPAPPSAATAGRPEFSSSHQGLAEKPAPGGGMMIDLQGRFRSAATATVGADGKPNVDCIAPGTAGGKE